MSFEVIPLQLAKPKILSFKGDTQKMGTDLYIGNSGFNFYFDEKNRWKHREKSFKAFYDDLRNKEYGIPGITEDKAREYYNLLLELGYSVINIRYFTIHLENRSVERYLNPCSRI